MKYLILKDKIDKYSSGPAVFTRKLYLTTHDKTVTKTTWLTTNGTFDDPIRLCKITPKKYRKKLSKVS
jgi:hypothetical protein